MTGEDAKFVALVLAIILVIALMVHFGNGHPDSEGWRYGQW